MTLDKRAVKILMQTFWSSAGWRREPEVEPADLAYAQTKGVMFDSVSLSHDEVLKSTANAVAKTTRFEVADAFISSLSTRRLDLRSALGSFAVGRHICDHFIVNNETKSCAYCGEYSANEVNKNLLNFSRIKWGGVTHHEPSYIAFDLELFTRLERPTAQPEDFELMRAIFDVIEGLPANGRLNDLEKALTGVFPSNRSERRTLIGILGFAGILIDPSKPDFRSNFVPMNEREETPWHTDDWPYPVQWWTASKGINKAAVLEWFPEIQTD